MADGMDPNKSWDDPYNVDWAANQLLKQYGEEQDAEEASEKYEEMYKIYTRDQERVREAWDLIDKLVGHLKGVLDHFPDEDPLEPERDKLFAEIEEKRKLHG